MRGRNLLIWIPAGLALCVLVYYLPPVHTRLSGRVSLLRERITYAINPPDEALFVPEEDARQEAILQATQLASTPSATLSPTDVPETPMPTFTQTITPTALPERVELVGVVYVDQHNRWNYCGPANLSMALNFWGWSGNRDTIARAIKPGVNDDDLEFIDRGRTDKNVMPYEMAGFVLDETDYGVVMRNGGDIEMVKNFIANGFPVLIEKGYYEADYTGKVGWLGHYQFVTGYDEGEGSFIVQDAYLEPGEDLMLSYEKFIEGWRSFNYLFMVIYPPEREAEVFELMGPWIDPNWANQRALETALVESAELEGIDQFFAWFNQGSSYTSLLDYGNAGLAFDQAFLLYAELGDDDTQRPYRIMWYQTGPYWAYFYTGRYQDVIDLADTTLYDTVAEPTLEESLYWRGRAREVLGDLNGAIADYLESVRLNMFFDAAWEQLNRLGVSP